MIYLEHIDCSSYAPGSRFASHSPPHGKSPGWGPLQAAILVVGEASVNLLGLQASVKHYFYIPYKH